MSESDDHTGVPDDDLLAAEYVLGVLDAADRTAAARRIERDRAFARSVAEWETRLAPWTEEIALVVPPAAVWDRIAAALPAARPQRAGLWQSLAFWRVFGLAGALASACLAVVIYLGAFTPQPPLIAAIEGGGQRQFVATIDVRRGSIAVVPAAYAADASRVPELWLIPADGKPRAVGLLRADRAVTLALPAELVPLARSSAVLAVSLEPPGGSTTGAPTGPVIAQGKLTNL